MQTSSALQHSLRHTARSLGQRPERESWDRSLLHGALPVRGTSWWTRMQRIGGKSKTWANNALAGNTHGIRRMTCRMSPPPNLRQHQMPVGRIGKGPTMMRIPACRIRMSCHTPGCIPNNRTGSARESDLPERSLGTAKANVGVGDWVFVLSESDPLRGMQTNHSTMLNCELAILLQPGCVVVADKFLTITTSGWGDNRHCHDRLGGRLSGPQATANFWHLWRNDRARAIVEAAAGQWITGVSGRDQPQFVLNPRKLSNLSRTPVPGFC
jgi:hypothetical protein